MFLNQISRQIKKDSQQIIRPTFDVFKSRWHRSSGLRSSYKMLGSKHFSTQRSSVLASLSPRHNKHKQQGSEKVSGNGNRRVHHIKAVIIEGKAHRCIHARVLLLLNGRQQRSRWARKLTAGLEILHWISNWGMNEFLQAVCNAIECFCRVMERQWRSLELYLVAIHTSFVSTI